MDNHATRYQRLRERLCPECPLYRTCPQFAEQLDACADAAALVAEESLLPDEEDEE